MTSLERPRPLARLERTCNLPPGQCACTALPPACRVPGRAAAQDKNTYYGALVGRVANRIAGGRFSLDGKAYRLAQNDGAGPSALHGGRRGFDKQRWRGQHVPCQGGERVCFTRTSPAGEEVGHRPPGPCVRVQGGPRVTWWQDPWDLKTGCRPACCTHGTAGSVQPSSTSTAWLSRAGRVAPLLGIIAAEGGQHMLRGRRHTASGAGSSACASPLLALVPTPPT